MNFDDVTTHWDELWRWIVVVLAVVAAAAMFGLWVEKWNRSRKGVEFLPFAESMALWGGTLVCLAVAVGTLGVLLGWSWEARLPFLAVALSFTVVGRGIQLTRRGKG